MVSRLFLDLITLVGIVVDGNSVVGFEVWMEVVAFEWKMMV